MHDYKKYDRSFILLSPESGGYAADGQKLTGTAILEIRGGMGKATINIQGLKASAAAIYKMYLISSKDGGATGVCLGSVVPNEKGKARGSWEFDPVSIEGSGLEYIDFNVVAVIVRNGDFATNELIAPLVGYKNGVVIWKSGFREHSKDSRPRAAAESVAKAEAATETLMKIPLEPEHGFASSAASVPEITAEAASEAEKETPPSISMEAEWETATGLGVEAETEREAVIAPENAPEASEAFNELSKRFSGATNFDYAEHLHINLKKTIPPEKYERFLKLLVTVANYIPVGERERLLLLLEEGAGFAHHIPPGERKPFNEMLAAVGEYVPGKVTESIVEVFDDIVRCIPHGEFERFSAVLKRCADFYRTGIAPEKQPHIERELKYFSMDSLSCEGEAGTFSEKAPEETLPVDTQAHETQNETCAETGAEQEENAHVEAEAVSEPLEKERVRLRSGVEGTYTLREPAPGEDHNARFKETLRAFNERFEKIDERLDAYGTSSAETAAAPSRPGRDSRPESHGGHSKFREPELYRLFEQRKIAEPFHFPNDGPTHHHEKPGFPPAVYPGFPPAVPPVIPVYDIRWIQITQNDIYLLPEKLWLYASNPFVAQAYRGYGHLILGVAGIAGGRQYYLGVPGNYSERDRIRALSLGFTGFMPVNGGVPTRGELGYWILKAY